MKRFITYSLSATVLLALGSAVAQAEMNQEPTEGIISPDSQSPSNREVPGEGATGTSQNEQGAELTDGIISPDSQSPNNREIPDEGTTGEAMPERDPNSIDGIISPDSQSPNNRVTPGTESAQNETLTYEEAFELYRETGVVNSYKGASSDSSSPTEGIISPDSQSPNNRATPDSGAIEPMEEEMVSPNATEGIISPDSQSPNNRAIPDEGTTEGMVEAEDADEIDGIISPDSQSPNNRETPAQ